MSIKVTCPNGHALQVRSEFAGKSGLCPHCKARIVVPKPEPEIVSEDELLEVLGPPRMVHHMAMEAPSDPPPQQQSVASNQEPKKDETVGPSGSSLLRRKK